MPAPRGNKNRLTHGIRSFLSTGHVPRGAEKCKQQVARMRREVEEEIEDRKGALSLFDAALVQEVARAEMAVQLMFRWLSEQGDELPIETRVRLLSEIRHFTKSRNEAIEKTGIGKAAKERVIDALYAEPNEHEQKN